MSVLIKGMEMPKEGFVEILIRDDGTVQQTGQSYRIDGEARQRMVTTMYDDLVKKLRYCGNAVSCIHCPYWEGCEGSKEDLIKAADAIEELICEVADEHNARLDAADAIEELRKAVLRLEDESGIYDELPTFYIYPTKWIPVTERLPKYGTKVLVFAYGHDVLTARLCKNLEFDYPVFDCNGIYNELAKQGRITHWMPLPEPPKDGE